MWRSPQLFRSVFRQPQRSVRSFHASAPRATAPSAGRKTFLRAVGASAAVVVAAAGFHASAERESTDLNWMKVLAAEAGPSCSPVQSPEEDDPAHLARAQEHGKTAFQELQEIFAEIPEDSPLYSIAQQWLERAEQILADPNLAPDEKAMQIFQLRRYMAAIKDGPREPQRRGVRVVDDVSFGHEVFDNEKDIVLFTHGGSTCIACTVSKPRIDLLALALADVDTLQFVKMNVTEPHCRHISPEDGFVYPVARVFGAKKKKEAGTRESNVGKEIPQICTPTVDPVEAIKLIHAEADHKFDLDKVLERYHYLLQYFSDLPDYRRRRPEHLWLPKEAEDAVIGRRNLARYYFDLRGFEAVVADDSSWIRDPQYQAPNGSRSSVLLSGGSKHKNKKKKTKKQKHDNKQGSEESEPMKRKRNDVDDPSDFLTLVNYIWGPLAADAFRYQAEEIVRNYEVWDPEAESEFLNFLEGNEVDENDIAILQFIVQTNLARYNVLKRVVDSRRQVARKLSDELEELKQKIRMSSGNLPEQEETGAGASE